MDDSNNFVVDDKGDYRFTLKLAVATSAGALDALGGSAPAPLVFDLNLPYLAVQHLAFRNGTQAMFSKTWKPASSADAGVSKTGAEEPTAGEAAAPEPAAPTQEQAAPQIIEVIPEKPTPPPPAQPTKSPTEARATLSRRLCEREAPSPVQRWRLVFVPDSSLVTRASDRRGTDCR